jgi:hypothetical protein
MSVFGICYQILEGCNEWLLHLLPAQVSGASCSPSILLCSKLHQFNQWSLFINWCGEVDFTDSVIFWWFFPEEFLPSRIICVSQFITSIHSLWATTPSLCLADRDPLKTLKGCSKSHTVESCFHRHCYVTSTRQSANNLAEDRTQLTPFSLSLKQIACAKIKQCWRHKEEASLVQVIKYSG